MLQRPLCGNQMYRTSLTEQHQAEASSSLLDEQQPQTKGTVTSEPKPQHTSTPGTTQQEESDMLQFVDTEGTPSGLYKSQQQTAAVKPKRNREHYYYPNIPPKSFGRGEQRNVWEWLEDNPQYTEADFYWLRQNTDQIPPFSGRSRADDNSYLTEDEGQFHDAS